GEFIDTGKEFRVEWANCPEALWTWSVAIGMPAMSIYNWHVEIHFRPIIIVRRRWTMRGGDQRENLAGMTQGSFDGSCRVSKILAEKATPLVGVTIRVIHMAPPNPIGIKILFEVTPTRAQRGIRVCIAPARQP